MVVKLTNLPYRKGDEYDDTYYVLEVEKINTRGFKYKVVLTTDKVEVGWWKKVLTSLNLGV